MSKGGSQLPGPEIRALWSKPPYKAQDPLPETVELPSGFPTQPLAHFEDPNYFFSLSIDTLMFIFYHQSVREMRAIDLNVI